MQKKWDDDGMPTRHQSVALVVGVTAIVGLSLAEILPLPDTPGGPWKVYGVSRRPPHPSLHPAGAAGKLAPLTNVTHIFHALGPDHRGQRPNAQKRPSSPTPWASSACACKRASSTVECDGGGFSAAEAMAGTEGVWEEIVREEGLVATRLEEVAQWWFVDAALGYKELHLDSMNKSKEHGFLGFRNTHKSFLSWIDKLKTCKIVP